MSDTDKSTASTLPTVESCGLLPAEVALRRRAEEIVDGQSTLSLTAIKAMPPEEIQRMLHELEVHRIELAMQNEELYSAHLQLDAERSRYAHLYDLAPVGYCTLNEQNLILEANFTVASLLGVAPGFLRRQPFTRFILSQDQDLYYLHRKKLLKSTEPQACELRMLQDSGAHFWVRLVSTRVVNDDGTHECCVVLNDITERKQAEEKRVRLQAQLMQAQKMESIGRLAGGVAHDFNNMLGVILGIAEMAGENLEPTSPLCEDLHEISKAALRSVELTRQLLAFARKQIVAPQVLDINDTVEGLLKMLRRLIREDIQLAWLPGTNLWPVSIDPTQVDQILANLCVNARDAAIHGTGKITIETSNVTLDAADCADCADHPDVLPGEYILLTVGDDGCGMDPATLALIFEPFFTTKEVGVGTGLGLSMVYGIVRQNKGFITVSSAPEQGATFRIHLPRHGGTMTTHSREEEGRTLLHASKTILLVEDEESFLLLNKRILESLGCTVIAAAAPDEALRLAREYPGTIDLLLTDVIMPGINGRDLAVRLQQLYPPMKQLFMSGYTSDVIAHHGALDQGVCFLQKPFLKRDLVAKINEVFL